MSNGFNIDIRKDGTIWACQDGQEWSLIHCLDFPKGWDGSLTVSVNDEAWLLDTVELDRNKAAIYKGFESEEEWDIHIMLRESESEIIRHQFDRTDGPEPPRERLMFVLQGMGNRQHVDFRRKITAVKCLGLRERLTKAFNKLAAECGCPAMPES